MKQLPPELEAVGAVAVGEVEAAAVGMAFWLVEVVVDMLLHSDLDS